MEWQLLLVVLMLLYCSTQIAKKKDAAKVLTCKSATARNKTPAMMHLHTQNAIPVHVCNSDDCMTVSFVVQTDEDNDTLRMDGASMSLVEDWGVGSVLSTELSDIVQLHNDKLLQMQKETNACKEGSERDRVDTLDEEYVKKCGDLDALMECNKVPWQELKARSQKSTGRVQAALQSKGGSELDDALKEQEDLSSEKQLFWTRLQEDVENININTEAPPPDNVKDEEDRKPMRIKSKHRIHVNKVIV